MRNGMIIAIVLFIALTGVFSAKAYEDTCLPEKFMSEIIFDPQNAGKHPPFFLPGEQVQVKIEYSRSPKGCEGFDVVLKSDSPYVSFQNPIKKSRSLEMTMIISLDPDIVRSANPKIIAMLTHGSRSIILEKDIIIGKKTQIQELTVAPVGLPISFHSFDAAIGDSGKNSLSYCLLVLTSENGIETDRKDKTVVYGKPMPKIRLMPNEAGIYTVTANCKNFAGASKVATNTFLVNLSETKKDKPYIITASALNAHVSESFDVDFSGTNSYGRGLKATLAENGIVVGQCGSSKCIGLLNSTGMHKLKLDMQYQFANFKYSGISSVEIWVDVIQNQSGLPQQPSIQQYQQPSQIATAASQSTSSDNGGCGKNGEGCKTSPGIGIVAGILALVILALRKRK